MSELSTYVNKMVLVITSDGRVIVGTLRGYDQTTNIILDKCSERVFSPDGTETVPLGLYLIRGDNICIVGEVDKEADDSIDLSEVKVEPLQQVTH